MNRDSNNIYNRRTSDINYSYYSSSAISNMTHNQSDIITVKPKSDGDVLDRIMPSFSDEHVWLQCGVGSTVLLGGAAPTISAPSLWNGVKTTAPDSGILADGWHHFPADAGWTNFAVAPLASSWVNTEGAGYGDMDSLYVNPDYRQPNTSIVVTHDHTIGSGGHNGIQTTSYTITGSPATEYYCKVVVKAITTPNQTIKIKVSRPGGYVLDKEYTLTEANKWYTFIDRFEYSGTNGSSVVEVLHKDTNSAGFSFAIDTMAIYAPITEKTYEVSHATFNAFGGAGSYVMMDFAANVTKPWTQVLDYDDVVDGSVEYTNNNLWGWSGGSDCYIGQINTITSGTPNKVTVSIGAVPPKGDYMENKFGKNLIPWCGYENKLSLAGPMYFYDLAWYRRSNGFFKIECLHNPVNLTIDQFDDIPSGCQDITPMSGVGEYWDAYQINGDTTSLDDWAMEHGQIIQGRLKSIRLSQSTNSGGSVGLIRLGVAPDHIKVK
mgnify:CR=1 FL=1